jgi:hypothetical protein
MDTEQPKQPIDAYTSALAGCAAHGLAHPCEVCAAESQLEQMRQDGNADDVTEAAAHLERVKHEHGVAPCGGPQPSDEKLDELASKHTKMRDQTTHGWGAVRVAKLDHRAFARDVLAAASGVALPEGSQS